MDGTTAKGCQADESINTEEYVKNLAHGFFRQSPEGSRDSGWIRHDIHNLVTGSHTKFARPAIRFVERLVFLMTDVHDSNDG